MSPLVTSMTKPLSSNDVGDFVPGDEQETKLGFVHLDRRSSGERQSVGEAVEEDAGDFDDLVGRW